MDQHCNWQTRKTMELKSVTGKQERQWINIVTGKQERQWINIVTGKQERQWINIVTGKQERQRNSKVLLANKKDNGSTL